MGNHESCRAVSAQIRHDEQSDGAGIAGDTINFP
jgi:hypothetical protein